MERKNISYTKGITRSPSDMLCQDGDLAECINLEIRNEELIPMEMPVKMGFSLASGEKLILVHNTKNDDKNYVVLYDGSALKIFYINDGSKIYHDFSLNCGEIKLIQYIGNTIVAYTSDNPHYILYTKNGYKYLGTKIPEVGITFDLSGEFLVGETFNVTTPDSAYESEEYQSEVVSQLIPQVNKFIAEKAIADGRFVFPFFVRYAIRLFNGTHVHHSAPILMYPSTYFNPYCSFARETTDTDLKGKTYKSQVGGMVSSLEAYISSVDSYLPEWSDIISGVDVFVSRQVYTYDQNGIKFGDASISALSSFTGKYNGQSSIWNIYSIMAGKTTIEKSDTQYLDRWWLPTRGLETVYSDIVATSLFYKFKTIELGDVSSGNTISLDGILAALETGEPLKDDYMTHDVMVPKSSFVYNGRLNISNITRNIFSGFSVPEMVQLVKNSPSDGFDYLGLTFGSFDAYVFIKSSSGGDDVIVNAGRSAYGGLYAPYFFYPDTDAYKIVLWDSSNNLYAEYSLTSHPLLNGAYYFGGFLSDMVITSSSLWFSTTDNKEYMPNKLFTSEVNNPFHFPLEGIYTVGNGEIIGMVAVTRPISQGQFGEYPLMMFCSDGNYAMKVDSEGFYERISPIQEDIVLGNDKISSLENSIAVITKKGIMITTGGEMNRIDSNMDGSHFDVSSLPGIGELMEHHNSILNYSSDSESFLSYVYGARMSYDYSSNRLLIYNPNKTYAYFYYFDNGTLSKITFEGDVIVTSVSDYPDNIIQTSSGSLYSLYEKRDINTLDNTIYGVAVTRPLKLDNPLAYKALYGLKNLGRFGKDSTVAYKLYGSMDGNDYFPVLSLRRRSYLFYRLVLYVNLKPKEAVSGTIIDFDYRMSHKFR